ncbi:MAG: hypothetical protein ACFFDH_00705 [Promethearchaeota archaeon]
MTIEKAKKFPFETKTSFHRNVEIKGKKHEGDLLRNIIIKLGKDLGLGGDWAWRMGNGFFIAIGAFMITLIGALINNR